jgi:phosphinothricin acetyltransferase
MIAAMTKPAACHSVRLATMEDCPAILEIYNHYILHETSTFQEVAETLKEREKWFLQHGAQHPIVVIEVGGAVVGWASLSPFHTRSAYRFSIEDSIYLHREWCGKGLGSVLLKDIIERASALGYHTLVAGVTSERTASIRLHEKHGFVKVAHFREVGFKFSRWLDVIYMQRQLP